jgi:rubredoxin
VGQPHYQCQECLTIYDETLGDLGQGIDPGISFNQLPDAYTCPTCGANKGSFTSISLKK